MHQPQESSRNYAVTSELFSSRVVLIRNAAPDCVMIALGQKLVQAGDSNRIHTNVKQGGR
ncbi:hypothetical protein FHW00_003061 [Ochrobactrum sp. P6BSIII]|jgi:hypothetical protein|nr:hypothetical protein [Ochrobactrum sp. P6BSIII]